MAKNQNPFAEFFPQQNMADMFKGYNDMPFDMKTLMETQRKNIQALTEAQKLTIENLQAVAQRQSEIISQVVEDQSAIAKQILAEGSPQDKMSQNAEGFKSLYERTVNNLREVGDMINKSNIEASNIINKRVSATMSEIQDSLEKTPAKKAA